MALTAVYARGCDSGYRSVHEEAVRLGNFAGRACIMESRFMREALSLAVRARDMGEVPVGAVVVLDDRVIGTGFNQPIGANDPQLTPRSSPSGTPRSESATTGSPAATLYVTIEPCQMCVGAMIHARIARVVYGTRNRRQARSNQRCGRTSIRR